MLFSLVIGYVFHPDGTMDTVCHTDLQLYEHGENGNDPDHLEFNFIAGENVFKSTMSYTFSNNFLSCEWNLDLLLESITSKCQGYNSLL